MKNNYHILLIVTLLVLINSPVILAKNGTSEYMDFDFKEVKPSEILMYIHKTQGVNFVFNPDLDKPVTLRMKDVHFEKGLSILTWACGASYRKIGNTYVVNAKSNLEKSFELNLFKAYRLQFIKAEEAYDIIKAFYDHKRGLQNSTYFPRLNLFAASGTMAGLDSVSKLIKTIDVPRFNLCIKLELIKCIDPKSEGSPPERPLISIIGIVESGSELLLLSQAEKPYLSLRITPYGNDDGYIALDVNADFAFEAINNGSKQKYNHQEAVKTQVSCFNKETKEIFQIFTSDKQEIHSLRITPEIIQRKSN